MPNLSFCVKFLVSCCAILNFFIGKSFRCFRISGTNEALQEELRKQEKEWNFITATLLNCIFDATNAKKTKIIPLLNFCVNFKVYHANEVIPCPDFVKIKFKVTTLQTEGVCAEHYFFKPKIIPLFNLCVNFKVNDANEVHSLSVLKVVGSSDTLIHDPFAARNSRWKRRGRT